MKIGDLVRVKPDSFSHPKLAAGYNGRMGIVKYIGGSKSGQYVRVHFIDNGEQRDIARSRLEEAGDGA